MRIILLIAVMLVSVLTANANPKIHEYLNQKMNETRSGELLPIYIVFSERLTHSDFSDISYDTPKKERRAIVIDRLKRFSDEKQRDVRSFLQLRSASNEARDIEILWMANAIILKANANVINELAGRYSNIAMIAYDAEYPVEQLYDSDMTSTPFAQTNVNAAIEPGILLMNADDCWTFGNRGEGVLVANSDDGFHWKHPDVVKGMWQNLGEDANNNGMTVIWGTGTTSVFDPGDVNGIDNDGNGKVDDFIGWDFTTNNYNITTASHGTATLGHVVGDGTGGTQTGVAPKSKSLIMRNASGQSQQWLAFQYAFLMGADVVTSSLSWKWYMNPKPDYSMFRTITDASLAGGMLHTNSTSNDGNSVGIPLNISSAGNCPAPWRHPEQLKIGGLSGVIGVGNVNCNTDIIATSSPYGPMTWGNWSLWGAYTYTIASGHDDYPYSRVAPVEVPDSMGLLKPDLSAPGESSISTYVSSGSGYGTFGGTSSATPHTAGAVALMLSINPEMLPGDVDKVLELTSVEKGTPGKDNRYGTGRIDVFAATSSPKFTLAGINGGSNMVMNTTLASSDTARELVGLRISTNINPQVGSLKRIQFGMVTTALASHISSFDLYFDKDKNNIVSAGDIKLRSHPYVNGPLTFDSLKFKFLDSTRTIILAAKTTGSASGTQTVNIGLVDTNQVTAYYTTKPFATNFPFGTVTGIGNNTEVFSYALEQNYPNPFNPVTLIKYSVAKEGLVKITVYNTLGKAVQTIVNGSKLAGNYSVEFDGGKLSSGIYYYKIEAGNFTEVKKMILLK